MVRTTRSRSSQIHDLSGHVVPVTSRPRIIDSFHQVEVGRSLDPKTFSRLNEMTVKRSDAKESKK